MALEQTIRSSQHRWLHSAAVVTGYVVVFIGLVPALFLAIGDRADVAFQLDPLGDGIRRLLLIVGTAGATLLVWSMLELSLRGGGLPISHLPPTRLVTSGPYALIRHPIYVAFGLAFAGLGAGGSGSAGRLLVATPLLAAAITDYVLVAEQETLDHRYPGRGERHQPLVTGALQRARDRGWAALQPGLDRLANRVVLVRRGRTILVTFGLVIAVASAVGVVLAGGTLGAAGLSSGQIQLAFVLAASGLVVGGRVGWLLSAASMRAGSRRWRMVGFGSWGAYVGYLLAMVAVGRLTGHSFLWVLDRTLPVALLTAGLARLGCLPYGCCYGRPAGRGVTWTNPEAKVIREQGPVRGAQPRVPTQLLSSLGTLSAVAVAVVASLARPPEGIVAATVMTLYAIARLGIDSYRDPVFRGNWPVVSGQLFSGVVIAAGAWLFLTTRPAGAAASPLLQLDGGAMLRAVPAALLVAVVVFAATSYHRDRVGQW